MNELIIEVHADVEGLWWWAINWWDGSNLAGCSAQFKTKDDAWDNALDWVNNNKELIKKESKQ